jgi:flavorubredoxin
MPYAPPCTLVPGRLYALGGTVENAGMISWLPPDRGGWESLNAYVLLEDRKALIVDTQLPVVGSLVAAQARGFDLDEATILLTRAVEFDSLGNAELLEQVVPLKRLYVHYGAWQWIYFRDRPVPALEQLGWEPRTLDKDDRVELGPGREVTILPAPLRLLMASWAYDHATRTLFTSDGFSHAVATGPEQRVVTSESDHLSEADVLEHLSTKFDWLEDADTDPIRRTLDEVFSRFDVERIAPTLGCVLSGRDVVERHAAMLDGALRSLGARRPALEAART